MISAELRAITVEDIQLLRYWRNLDHVRSQMINGDLIGKENQKKWFNDLDKNNTKYFIYSLNKKDVGNVNISRKIKKKIKKNTVIVDGDKVRSYVRTDLGYSKKERKIQIKRIFGISKIFYILTSYHLQFYV